MRAVHKEKWFQWVVCDTLSKTSNEQKIHVYVNIRFHNKLFQAGSQLFYDSTKTRFAQLPVMIYDSLF